jgi:hypothetical protein
LGGVETTTQIYEVGQQSEGIGVEGRKRVNTGEKVSYRDVKMITVGGTFEVTILGGAGALTFETAHVDGRVRAGYEEVQVMV